MGAVFALLFLMSSTVFAVWRAVRIWRDPRYFNRAVRQAVFYPFRKDVQRGLVRGWLPFAVGGSALTLGMPAIIVGDAQPGVSVWLVIGLALFVIFMAGIALQLVVVWFNRPRWCVPPYLRAEPGVWAQRRAAKARSRK